MNNLLNRLKLADAICGDSNYNRVNRSVDRYFNISSSERVIERVIKKEESPMNLAKLMFLNNHDDDILKTLRKELLLDSENIIKYLDNVEVENLAVMKEVEDVDLFKSIIDTKLYKRAKNIIENKKDNYNSLMRLLGIAKEYDWDAPFNSNNCRGQYVNLSDFMAIANSLTIMDNCSDSEINNIVVNCEKDFNVNLTTISEEELEIMKSREARFIKRVSLNELNLVRLLKEYLSDYDLNDVGGIDCNVLDYPEESTIFVENVKESFENKDDIEEQLKIFIRASKSGFIKNEKDITLLVNKVKYGAKYENVLEVGFELAGISLELYNQYYMDSDDLADLIEVKKIVSKSVYKKIINNEKIMEDIYCVNLKALQKFVDVLELGQLNENQLESMWEYINEKSYRTHRIMDFDVTYKLSFDEFELILLNLSYVENNFVESLKDLKQTQRLLKLKEHIEINKIVKNGNTVAPKSLIVEIAKDLEIKKAMKNNNPLKINDMTEYLDYLAIKSKINVQTIKDLIKIKFVCKFKEFNNIENLTMAQIEECIWESEEVSDLISQLNLSDEFIEEYKQNMLEFFISENSKLVISYLNNYRVKDTQRRGILLITKAIMAGKYDELKFVHSDIKKEISLDISEEAFNCWKTTNVVAKGSYVVKDSSDFNTIMRMGEIPVRSCMNYVNGMYSHCLLSNFDTSKKMLTIHKNGKYVGRAVLRLTVMSDNDKESTNLEFLDVDAKNNESDKHGNHSKELIIFLEKAYTTLDTNDMSEVYPVIIELLKDKANIMGAKVVASNNYYNYIGDDCQKVNKYVFITASKNGAQYLDSFDGSTSSAYCYKNGNVYVY